MKNIVILLITLILVSCNTLKPVQQHTMLISANTTICQGVIQQECMLVKYKKDQAEWTYFYDAIEGFNFEKGYEFEILVSIDTIKNPAADASNLKYTLKKIISKTKKEIIENSIKPTPTEPTGNLPLTNTQWIIENFNTKQSTEIIKNCHFNIDNSKVSFNGSDGCNSIFGKVNINGNSIKFTNIASTKKMCKKMEQPQLFVNNLMEIDRYEIKGAELFLYKNNTLMMTMESFR